MTYDFMSEIEAKSKEYPSEKGNEIDGYKISQRKWNMFQIIVSILLGCFFLYMLSKSIKRVKRYN